MNNTHKTETTKKRKARTANQSTSNETHCRNYSMSLVEAYKLKNIRRKPYDQIYRDQDKLKLHQISVAHRAELEKHIAKQLERQIALKIELDSCNHKIEVAYQQIQLAQITEEYARDETIDETADGTILTPILEYFEEPVQNHPTNNQLPIINHILNQPINTTSYITTSAIEVYPQQPQNMMMNQ